MDIVERLRENGSCMSDIACCYDILNESADEIERLREALRLERQLKDDALRAFNEAQVALKEGK